jgi:hypothetical protein
MTGTPRSRVLLRVLPRRAVMLLVAGFAGLLGVATCAPAGASADAAPIAGAAAAADVASVEQAYADAVDAAGVLTAIDSGLFESYEGKGRAEWEKRYRAARSTLVSGLASGAGGVGSRSARDAHALRTMRGALSSTLPENPSSSAGNLPPSSGKCATAARTDLDAAALGAALYACFDELGNHIRFEGRSIPRDSALAMLSQIAAPERRKALFLGFEPLWRAVNGNDEGDSPYRRRLKLAAAKAAHGGSRVEIAARALGEDAAAVETWLTQVLEAWRRTLPDRPVEPWDYRYEGGGADRLMAEAASTAALLPANRRFYRDLGADLDALGVRFDIQPRPGKSPISYTSYVTMGRLIDGRWRPTIPRVSASFGESGLYVMNMLVHEDGHAAHYGAIRNRPAFMDIGADDLFCESFADVTSWSVYDSAWQRKYLGRAAPEQAGLRSRYTMVTLEVTWALFEARMLRHPEADPNAVWTDITSRYLNIVPHPELSWWAQRVQLVTSPGFMINYGLGAVLTAEMRARIAAGIGPFDAGNTRWYPWVTAHLLQQGAEIDTRRLMQALLGRPVSPQALIDDIRRLSPP